MGEVEIFEISNAYLTERASYRISLMGEFE
jgi:hypothetical protein